MTSTCPRAAGNRSRRAIAVADSCTTWAGTIPPAMLQKMHSLMTHPAAAPSAHSLASGRGPPASPSLTSGAPPRTPGPRQPEPPRTCDRLPFLPRLAGGCADTGGRRLALPAPVRPRARTSGQVAPTLPSLRLAPPTRRTAPAREPRTLPAIRMSRGVAGSSVRRYGPPRMVTLEDVKAARSRISDQIYLSPCAKSLSLSRLAGCETYLKLENLQMTGAYKERGPLNKLLCLSPAERAAGLVAASAGNHAQAVAYHAGRLGIPATIVMPEGTPLIKVANTRGHGARVVLSGSNYDEAYTEARRVEQAEGLTFIHPFDDPFIIAGQGTI